MDSILCPWKQSGKYPVSITPLNKPHITIYVGLPTNQVSRNNKHTVCWNDRLINDESGYSFVFIASSSNECLRIRAD